MKINKIKKKKKKKRRRRRRRRKRKRKRKKNTVQSIQRFQNLSESKRRSVLVIERYYR
jgi:hypothetical protein